MARPYVKSGLYTLKRRLQVQGLAGIDRRSRAARALAAWRAELEDDLGGQEAITAQQRAVLDAVSVTKLSDGTRIYEFSGRGVLDPVLAGVLPALLNNSNDLKRWWPQRDSNPCFSYDHVFATFLPRLQYTPALEVGAIKTRRVH